MSDPVKVGEALKKLGARPALVTLAVIVMSIAGAGYADLRKKADKQALAIARVEVKVDLLMRAQGLARVSEVREPD